MSLPNPSMSFTPFDPLTAAEMNDIVENVEALSDGSGLEDDAVTVSKLDSNLVASSYVSTSESRGSTSYGALSTADTCTLTVPASGKVKLSWGALADSSGTALTAWMQITLTGANSASYVIRCSVPASGANVGASMFHSVVLTGLSTGSTTFTATYKGSASTSTNYSTRSIIVEQIP